MNNLEESFDRECWYIVSWEQLQNGLAFLQLEGKITSLRYRSDDEDSGCFIVNFTLTDKYRWPDLFNVIDEYEPSDDQKEKEWIWWA